MSQLCKLITRHLVAKIARKYGIDKQARTFSPWSHVVALLYAQLSYAFSMWTCPLRYINITRRNLRITNFQNTLNPTQNPTFQINSGRLWDGCRIR